MSHVTYEEDITALLVTDSYKNVICEGGKFWDRLEPVAETNHCVPKMLKLVNAALQDGASCFLCAASPIPHIP